MQIRLDVAKKRPLGEKETLSGKKRDPTWRKRDVNSCFHCLARAYLSKGRALEARKHRRRPDKHDGNNVGRRKWGGAAGWGWGGVGAVWGGTGGAGGLGWDGGVKVLWYGLGKDRFDADGSE